ncbi:hypothetical protein [Methylobacterium marchantiae]|uniref:Uncharacterized protein n=1 Tax=Methylobacterium marchantiae TaxID=600331 RepID=A0ABW3WUZ9_9HYPH
MAISRRDESDGQPSADAESIVVALERAAAMIPTNPPSRKTVDVAKRLYAELRPASQGRRDAKALIVRGRAAFRLLQEANRPGETDAEEGAASAEQGAGDDAAFADNVDRMRRIVGALEAAARTENPSRFTEQARLCKQIWDDIGPAGPEGPALRKAYRKASAKFWAKAGMQEPGGADGA